jgi:hypothetical protein
LRGMQSGDVALAYDSGIVQQRAVEVEHDHADGYAGRSVGRRGE